jgi:ribonuclease P protein component
LIGKEFTLGRKERLRSRKLIDKVFNEGKSFSVFPYRIYYLKAIIPLQFGVGVSKKNFRRAVDRNRIKRLSREAYRLQKRILDEKTKEKGKSLSVFFIYIGKELPAYPALFEKMHVILKRLINIADEDDTNSA